MPYYDRDPKRDHNFDNHPCVSSTRVTLGLKVHVLAPKSQQATLKPEALHPGTLRKNNLDHSYTSGFSFARCCFPQKPTLIRPLLSFYTYCYYSASSYSCGCYYHFGLVTMACTRLLIIVSTTSMHLVMIIKVTVMVIIIATIHRSPSNSPGSERHYILLSFVRSTAEGKNTNPSPPRGGWGLGSYNIS